MSAIAAAALTGVAISGYEVAQSEKQKSQGRNLAKNNPFIPQVMPSAVKEATKLAQQNYTNGMPGQQYATQQIQRTAGNAQFSAARGASSGGDILDSANKIQLGTNDATRQLAMQASSYKSNALGGYEAALNTEAGWEDQLYKNNTLSPYLRTANTAASLQGAGSVNEAAAIDNAGTSLMAGFENYGNAKYKNYLARDGKTMGQFLGNTDLSTGRSAGLPSPSTKIDTTGINAQMAAAMLGFSG